VDGRHAEDAFAAELKRAHLQDHRKRFDHKNSADKKEQNLLLDNHGDSAQRSAK
jgi:hypothetical protein